MPCYDPKEFQKLHNDKLAALGGMSSIPKVDEIRSRMAHREAMGVMFKGEMDYWGFSTPHIEEIIKYLEAGARPTTLSFRVYPEYRTPKPKRPNSLSEEMVQKVKKEVAYWIEGWYEAIKGAINAYLEKNADRPLFLDLTVHWLPTPPRTSRGNTKAQVGEPQDAWGEQLRQMNINPDCYKIN